MFRSKDLPKWLLTRNIGNRIVMNQHNGLATQGLMERGKGAIAFWKISGYSPKEPRIMVFVSLDDVEAQKVFDADPIETWFLEPVWGSISDNRVAVDVLDVDGRRAFSSIELSRGLTVDEFLDGVEAAAAAALAKSKKKQPPNARNVKLVASTGFGKVLHIETRPDDLGFRIGKSPATEGFKANNLLRSKKAAKKAQKRSSGVGGVGHNR